eukprot:1154197-Pelagomonas_calceolata.AAC.7
MYFLDLGGCRGASNLYLNLNQQHYLGWPYCNWMILPDGQCAEGASFTIFPVLHVPQRLYPLDLPSCGNKLLVFPFCLKGYASGTQQCCLFIHRHMASVIALKRTSCHDQPYLNCPCLLLKNQITVPHQRCQVNNVASAVWVLLGGRIGQALMFSEYEEGGTKKKVQGYVDPNAAAAAPPRPPPPSEEDIKAAEDAAQQWASYVRQLKQEQGLPNKDPQVIQAVEAMQQWKARLAELQDALAQELEAAKALFDDDDEDDTDGKTEEAGGEKAT